MLHFKIHTHIYSERGDRRERRDKREERDDRDRDGEMENENESSYIVQAILELELDIDPSWPRTSYHHIIFFTLNFLPISNQKQLDSFHKIV